MSTITTIEDLEKLIGELNNSPHSRPISHMGSLSQTLSGIPVFKSEYMRDKVPVLELSSKVVVSNEFRKQFNQWALELFGTKTEVLMTDHGIYMSENSWKVLYNHPGITNPDSLA